MDVLDYLNLRIAELENAKKGESLDVKTYLNGGLVELKILQEKLVSERKKQDS